MVQEAWILSLLCPNLDEQADNQILSSAFRGNTEGKSKANSSSLHLLHIILSWFALSVPVLSWLNPQQDSQPRLSPSSCKIFRNNLLNQQRQKPPQISVLRDTLNEHLLTVSGSFGLRFAANKTQGPLCSYTARRVTPKLRLRRPLDITAVSRLCQDFKQNPSYQRSLKLTGLEIQAEIEILHSSSISNQQCSS